MPEPFPEFVAAAERIEQSNNPYLGQLQVGQLEAMLESPGKSDSDKIAIHTQLCHEHLRLGDVGAAMSQLELAKDLTAKSASPVPVSLLKTEAIAHLRAAEVANCIKSHNAQCCIFPLAGKGVHTASGPAAAAKRTLLEIVSRDPADRQSQWLLNIACMALDDFPAGVAEAYRIPPAALQEQSGIGRFVDVAAALGLDSFDLCGGVIIEDFDNDGFLDIVSSSSDPREPLNFFRNVGDGSFEDLSVTSGLARQLGGLNCIAGDYDNDGDVDILVLRGAWLEDLGKIRNSLLRNDGGNQFTDVTVMAGLADPAYPSQTAAWADFDNDGHLDLYVGNESRVGVGVGDPSGNYPNQLFRNTGDGTFMEVAKFAGLTNDRFCKGVTVGDYDNDGDMDIYVSNVGKNRLYQNNGAGKRFSDVAPELGLEGHAGYTFAPWFFDYDNDGWLDLFVASYGADTEHLLADYRGEPHRAVAPYLFRNRGDGSFENIAREAGLDHPYLPMGANFGDIDNDGFLDIYLATGDPNYETLMPNVMLHNVGGGGFENITYAAGLGHLQKGHGVAFADLDHDGDQDLYNQLGGFYPGDKFHNALFLNPGNANHHLSIELVGTKSNRSAVGARLAVTVNTPQGLRTIHRAVGSVSSFGGSPTARQGIGLGDASAIEKVEVTWPGGEKETFTGVPIDGAIRISQANTEIDKLRRKRISLD